jgi:hypothetical protein
MVIVYGNYKNFTYFKLRDYDTPTIINIFIFISFILYFDFDAIFNY